MDEATRKLTQEQIAEHAAAIDRYCRIERRNTLRSFIGLRPRPNPVPIAPWRR